MKRKILALTVIAAVSGATAFAGGEAVWSYEGETGPDKWGELAPTWAICSEGRYQSPIDIRGGVEAALPGINASIKPTPLSFGLDGPTFAVPYRSGSWLTVNGTRYELQQFHFHHPSEHTVNGKHFPMEAHLVLRSEGSSHNDAVMGAYYLYEGSMTTPGCPQGVRWFVLEQPVEASQVQIDRFVEDFTQGDSNNRPLQPAYGRVVLIGK